MPVRNLWRRLRRVVVVVVREDVQRVHSLMLGVVEIEVERMVEELGLCSCVVAVTVDHHTVPGVH
jgi:hypothetical protein